MEVVNYKNDLAYIIAAGPQVVVGSNYEEACAQLVTYGYLWKIVPSKLSNHLPWELFSVDRAVHEIAVLGLTPQGSVQGQISRVALT